MRSALIGSILVVAGMVLMRFSDRLDPNEFWFLIPGALMFLVGAA